MSKKTKIAGAPSGMPSARPDLQAREDSRHQLAELLESLDCTMAANVATPSEVEVSERLAALVLSVHAVPLSGRLAIDALFSPVLEQGTQEFIGAVLLHLLLLRPACLSESNLPFGHRSFALFDALYSDSLYGFLKLTSKSQRFEKEGKLHSACEALQRDLASASGQSDNLVGVEPAAQALLKTLFGPVGRALVCPLIDQQRVRSYLTTAMREIAKYVGAAPAAKGAAYNSARNALRLLRECATSQAGIARTHLVRAAESFSQVLTRDFTATPAAQPAELAIGEPEKKYPLDAQGRSFDICFPVANDSSGLAVDISIKTDVSANVRSQRTDFAVSQLGPQEAVTISVPCQVLRPDTSVSLTIDVEWTSAAGKTTRKRRELLCEAQAANVDWVALASLDPYSEEPVEHPDDLVGRQDILQELLSGTLSPSLRSFLIYGQKRVGKTSVAKTLACLLQESPDDCLVVYLEGGDYARIDARSTIAALGSKLCKRIRESSPSLGGIEIPSFLSGLSEISDFLENVFDIRPALRLLVILDEFDELPIEVYKRGDIGDSFFLTLRSIGAKKNVGFVLVGGEKMEFVLSCQGDALNKFKPLRIDYLDFAKHVSDFQDLVRRPVAKHVQYSDGAVARIHHISAGNPFFAKLLCRGVLQRMVNARDSHVTERDVQQSVAETLSGLASNQFQHFWEDGIVDSGERAEEASMRRRKVLLSLARVLRRGEAATLDAIASEAREEGIPETTVQQDIREFVRRQVLTQNEVTVACKLPLFGDWLTERGVTEIVTTFVDREGVLASRAKEDEAFVQASEIVSLVRSWGTYKGRALTPDDVRRWLGQFGANVNQRLMFQLLRGIQFYSEERVREKLRLAHETVRRGLTQVVSSEKLKRADIAIAYLDGPGKSGAEYARRYADENKILRSNVLEAGQVSEDKMRALGAQALVFLDDFVGTGQTISDGLAEHSGAIRRVAAVCKCHIIAVAGFEKAVLRLDARRRELGLNVEVTVLDQLDESDRCFNGSSKVFDTESSRTEAANLARDFGLKLYKKAPLGHGGCEALVVFYSSCPNNSLPILWADTNNWFPLFRRMAS